MTTKTALIVAQLWEQAPDATMSLVHTVPLYNGTAPDYLTYHHVTPTALQELEFEIEPEAFPTASKWKRESWGSADYIPLSEWVRSHGKEPEETNLVPRPGGEPLVIVRYVEYSHVKTF